MLNAVKELGFFAKRKNIPISKIAKKIASKKVERYYALFVNILENDEELHFDIIIEDFDVSKIVLYLFDEDNTKGNIQAPFLPFTDIEKTFWKKVYGWYKNFSKLVTFSKSSSVDFNKIERFLDANRDVITEKLSQKLSDFGENDKVFIGL
ncbi:MAG: TM1802 family CRISPR-associated protein, partial [Candidatus Kapaibacteriota bacterium]